ncbi:hypothetical protein P7C70_g145, partial [Phenoliferia sp. Uapishka_3]
MSIAPDPTNAAVSDPDERIGAIVERDQAGSIQTGPHQNFSFAAAAWLTTLATPLLLFPRILSLIFGTLLTESGDPDGEGKAEVIRQLNVLERTLAGMTGFACLSMAALLIIQTGAVPLTASISSPNNKSADAPFRTPTVLVVTAFFTALSWFSYELGMWLVTGVSGALCIWGAWAVTFGTDTIVNKSHEERGGSNSSFLFTNEHAEAKKE